MVKRKKIEWKDGDLFTITLNDSSFVLGQILDTPRPNQVRVVLFDERSHNLESLNKSSVTSFEKVVTAVMVTREQLDYGAWTIVGNSITRPIPVSQYPNEKFRLNKWIGSRTYDASLLEDFINAFYGLIYWDDWFDPNYLDEFLIDSSKKPKNLKLKSQS